MKIGIMTFHKAYNYGAELQAYALCTKIRKLGHEAEIIDYRDLYNHSQIFLKQHITPKNLIKVLIQIAYRLKKHGKFDRFARSYIPVSNTVYRNHDGLVTLDREQVYDVYVAGSDQIWNFEIPIYDESYLLNFVKDPNKKCAYAPSMGGSVIPENRFTRYKDIISDFRVLSLREESDIVRYKDFFGTNARPALDPTLLLTADDYKSIMPKRLTEKKYTLLYTITGSDRLKKIAAKTADQKGLKLIDLKRSLEVFSHCGPEDFISWIYHADYVFTNSFHGTAFSIIFQKQFSVELHNQNNYCNTRAGDLMDKLGLGGRDIDSAEYMLDRKINWDYTSRRLNVLRLNSENVLRDILGEKQLKIADNIIKPDEKLNSTFECYGCAACVAVCPHEAISMKENDFGFGYPVIDSCRCTGCGLCREVCQLEDPRALIREHDPAYYSARHTDENVVKQSSSGGIFTTISDFVLQSGGTVYGCILDENMKAVHIRAETVEVRDRMRGSKYIQSDCAESYKQVAEDLHNGRRVLYSGTPCQIVALYRYLEVVKQSDSGLYTQEVLCHGVASPQFFRDYIATLEQKYGGKAIHCNFRAHRKPGKMQDMEVRFNNGRAYHAVSTKEDAFYKFYKNMILRSSCYECPYAAQHRWGDISLGDHWSRKTTSTQDRLIDYSIIITSTAKGQQLLEGSRKALDISQCSMGAAIQDALKCPVLRPYDHDIFCSEYIEKGYEYIQKKYGNENFKGRVKLISYNVADNLGLTEAAKKAKTMLKKLWGSKY